MSFPQLYSFRDVGNSIKEGDLLFADTSFVWELYGADMSKRQRESKNFSNESVEKGSIFIISPKVEEELRNVAVREKLEAEAPKLGYQPYQRKKIINNTPDFMKSVHDRVDKILEIIDENPNFIMVDQDGDMSEAKKISSKYNIDLNDSIILATLFTEGIHKLVTLDKDYILVKEPELIIYTNEDNYQKLIAKQGKLKPHK